MAKFCHITFCQGKENGLSRRKSRPYLKLATPVLGCIMLAQGRSKINQLGKGGIISDGIINFYPALKSQDTLNFYF